MPPSTRWSPELGAVVRFRPHEGPTEADRPLPPGKWKLISRNDRGPLNWWALGLDDDARAWAAAHPGDIISGCIDALGTDLTPINGIRI
jgi:hypothetical protein